MKEKKDKIYYFQEKSNDILDLQDELNSEEIGIYFILKAGYFKYAGELKKENANQRCKFFGDINKFNLMIDRLFDVDNGLLVNNAWLSEINGIKVLSEKRKEIAKSRWEAEQQKKDPKPKKTQPVNHNSIYKQLADGLHLILEEKMQKAITTNGWENEIRKLIEIDLKVRQNPIEDVKKVIQAIADNYGKEYFPVIQSASSLREKFIKVENSINRNKSKQGGSSATDQYFNILNDLERGSND